MVEQSGGDDGWSQVKSKKKPQSNKNQTQQAQAQFGGKKGNKLVAGAVQQSAPKKYGGPGAFQMSSIGTGVVQKDETLFAKAQPKKTGKSQA